MLSITRGKGRPGVDGSGRRVRASLATSLAANAVILAVFAHAVARGYLFQDLFQHRAGEVPAERISFLRLPAGKVTQPGQSGGDGQRVSRGTPAPRPRPSATPAPAPSAPEPVTGTPGVGTQPGSGGSGAVVGQGGPTEGIRPTYADPRLWGRADVAVTAPRSAKQRMDSVIADGLTFARDSMLAARELAAGQRAAGDWTIKGKGGTWGVDSQYIRLGKLKVPNALLALLSSSFQQNLRGNPVLNAEARRMSLVRRDLLEHSQREIAEGDFQGAVRAIRARKDRERAARLAERRRPVEEAGTVAGTPTQQDRE